MPAPTKNPDSASGSSQPVSSTTDANQRQPTLIHRPCPLCGDQRPHGTIVVARDVNFNFPGLFTVVQCRTCNMLYTNPQVAPAKLSGFYPAEYSAHQPDRVTRHHRAGTDPWDLAPETRGKRLLDIGCGSGAYLYRLQKMGWDVFGVDPSASAVAAAQAIGVPAAVGDLSEIQLPQTAFDVITLLGVLDHIADPLLTLRRAFEVCDTNGRVIILVPNAASAARRIFDSSWAGWDLPRHQNHFTPDSLTAMLRKAGFVSVDLSWKRRTSQWHHGAIIRAALTGEWQWKILARSRRLCGILARLKSRGSASDEIIAVARKS